MVLRSESFEVAWQIKIHTVTFYKTIIIKDDRLLVQNYHLKTQWTFYQVFLRSVVRKENLYISKFHKASGHHIRKIGAKSW